MPDAALVQAASRGDREAFAALVAPRLDRLYATATLILRDSARAEDAVQDGLVRAWRDLRSLREPERFDAWLRRVVVNACRDESRRGRRREADVRLLPEHDGVTMDGASRLADRDELDRGLAGLSTDHRATLVLHYYLGLPLTDIADALAIPLGTAKSRLHHAREALREAIESGAQRGAGETL